MVSDEVIRETAALQGVPADQICPCENWRTLTLGLQGRRVSHSYGGLLPNIGFFGDGMRSLANQWLSHKEALRQEQAFRYSVELAHRAARAAERAARWAMLAAIVTALVGLITAGAVVSGLYRNTVAPVVQLKLEPAPEVFRAETELPASPQTSPTPTPLPPRR